MILETGRTILRHFEKKDLKDLNEYCSQDGVGEMAGWQHHCNLSISKDVLNRFAISFIQFYQKKKWKHCRYYYQ